MRALTLLVMIGLVLSGVRLLPGGTVFAQTLGELARQEEARRKSIKQPAKTYTNDNLRRSDLPPATAAPVPAQPPAPLAAPNGDDPRPTAAGEVRDEKYWRGRIDAAQTALSRAETLLDAVQTRVNSLAADFVNRDDPAQRNVIAAERQKALAELDRLKQEIAAQQKAIADTRDEARRANVPAGWVR
jgi:hypothetical protein